MGDDYHHNGAYMLMDAYFHFKKPVPNPSPQYPNGIIFPVKDNYEYFLRAGNIDAISKIMGDTIQLWSDMMAHPVYDSWWQARNIRSFADQVPAGVASLLVGGLFDAEDCFGTLQLYKAIEAKSKNTNKLAMGPWSHGQWGGYGGSILGNIQFGSNTCDWYGENVELPFFNYYLKGIGSADSIAAATMFFSGVNQWKRLPHWPPTNNKNQVLYLEANNKISFHENSQKQTPAYASYTSDPAKPVPYAEGIHLRRTAAYMTDDQRFAARRPDVLVYQTDTLTEDMTVAGPVTADLLVSISGTDADFVVKLIDVFPDDFAYTNPLANNYEMGGYQMLVRGDIMRGKFRNSFEKPEPFSANTPTHIKYDLMDVAHTFKKGHRIMVQIQSSWFPLFDRNPQVFTDIYHAKKTDYKQSLIRIYYNASRIILPVMQ